MLEELLDQLTPEQRESHGAVLRRAWEERPNPFYWALRDGQTYAEEVNLAEFVEPIEVESC